MNSGRVLPSCANIGTVHFCLYSRTALLVPEVRNRVEFRYREVGNIYIHIYIIRDIFGFPITRNTYFFRVRNVNGARFFDN